MRKKLSNELVYSTALGFFAKYGYKKTTLDDIAVALGMTNSNLYSYAKSKQDLYIDSITYAVDLWQDAVRKATEGLESATEKLTVAFQTAVDYIAYSETVKTLLKNDPNIFPMFPTSDPIEELNNWAVGFIQGILEQGVAQGEFRELNAKEGARLIFNFYKYFIISTFVDESGYDVDVKSQMATMSTLMFRGLLK